MKSSSDGLPYALQPSNQLLGKKRAKHLLGRTTYCVTSSQIEKFSKMTATRAVNELFNYKYNAPHPGHIIDVRYDKPWVPLPGPSDQSLLHDFNHYRIKSWWLDRARKDKTAQFKLSFFLHTCFTASFRSAIKPEIFFEHLKLLLFHTKGNYKQLAIDMTTDSMMVTYLNNEQNHKQNPNENYAREFLELFTIGKGPVDGPGSYTTYTEHDIKEAARIFTGWRWVQYRANVNKRTQITQARYASLAHDTGDKTLSGKFGNKVIKGSDASTELNQLVKVIFDKDATAQHICRKMYRFYVNDNIDDTIEREIIVPLAKYFKETGYALEFTIKRLIRSRHFFDVHDNFEGDNRYGGLVKSPLELVLNTLNFLKIPALNSQNTTKDFYTFYDNIIQNTYICGNTAMNLFDPPSVAGYPANYQAPSFSKKWFSNTTFQARYSFADMLVSGKRSYGIFYNTPVPVKLNPLSIINDSEMVPVPGNAAAVVNSLVEGMFPNGVRPNRRHYLLNKVFLDNLNPKDWELTWDAYKNGTNKAFTWSEAKQEVITRLQRLLKELIQSPEYQVY